MSRPFVTNQQWNTLSDNQKNDYISHWITWETSLDTIKVMSDDGLGVFIDDLDWLRIEYYFSEISEIDWQLLSNTEKIALFQSWVLIEANERKLKLIVLDLIDKYTIGNNIINRLRRDYF